MTAPDKPEGLIAGGEQVRSEASHNTPPAEEDRGEAYEAAKRLKKLAQNATPGPWSTKRPEGQTNGFAHGVVIAATAPGVANRIYADPPGGSFPSSDQNFIVAARNDIEAICDALLSTPRVERLWCLNCGTVTRDHRCHCTEVDQEPNFVNYADELARQLNAAASTPRVEETRLRGALRKTRNELYWCAEQLKARGLPGVPGDSVDVALAESAAALATERKE